MFPCFVRDGLLGMPWNTTEMIRQMKDGIYILDLKKEKSKATASMFGFLYGKIYPSILEEIGEFQTKENIERLDETLKKRFGTTHITQKYELRKPKSGGKPFIKNIETVEPKPKRIWSVDDMSQYWDALRQFAAEFWGMTLEEPDPDWKEKWGSNKA